MSNSTDSLRFLNIDINDSSIAELEENQRIIEVPINEIKEIYYKFGCGAERPVVNVILGTFFICLGLCVIPFIYSWFTEGGTLHGLHVAFLVSGIIGLWLISTVTISKHFLHVFTAKDKRKLIIRGNINQNELSEFFASIRERIQVEVREQ